MIEDVPSFLAKISSWLINEGSWFFPLALLVTNFTFKCFVNKRPDKIDFCQCVVALPAEIKVIACSFVFAAAIGATSEPAMVFALQIVGLAFLIVLGVSIGAYNYCEANKATSLEGPVLWYLLLSLFVAYFMLDTSIDFMKHMVK